MLDFESRFECLFTWRSVAYFVPYGWQKRNQASACLLWFLCLRPTGWGGLYSQPVPFRSFPFGAARVSQPDSIDLHGTGGNECFPANSFHSYQHFSPAQSSFIGVCRCFCNDSNKFPKNKSHARIHFNFPQWLTEAWYITSRQEAICCICMKAVNIHAPPLYKGVCLAKCLRKITYFIYYIYIFGFFNLFFFMFFFSQCKNIRQSIHASECQLIVFTLLNGILFICCAVSSVREETTSEG